MKSLHPRTISAHSAGVRPGSWSTTVRRAPCCPSVTVQTTRCGAQAQEGPIEGHAGGFEQLDHLDVEEVAISAGDPCPGTNAERDLQHPEPGRQPGRFGEGSPHASERTGDVDGHLDGDGTVEADLLVGADGFRSSVRDALSPGGEPAYAGFTVLRGVTAYPAPDLPGTLTLGESDQFGLFPMTAERVYWFASVASRQPLGPLDVHVRGELLARFLGWHDPVPPVLAASSLEEVVVSDIEARPPARPRARGRVALVGDAAQPLLPNLGQGTCQAFEDAAVLASCLGATGNVEAALRTYAAARRRRVRRIAAQARQLAVLGRIRHAGVCWVRDRMIRHAPQGPSLRRLDKVFDFDPEPTAVTAGR